MIQVDNFAQMKSIIVGFLLWGVEELQFLRHGLQQDRPDQAFSSVYGFARGGDCCQRTKCCGIKSPSMNMRQEDLALAPVLNTLRSGAAQKFELLSTSL